MVSGLSDLPPHRSCYKWAQCSLPKAPRTLSKAGQCLHVTYVVYTHNTVPHQPPGRAHKRESGAGQKQGVPQSADEEARQASVRNVPASSARVHVSGRARWRVAVISAAPLLPIPTGIAGEDSQRKTTLSSDHAAKLIQKHPAIPCPAHSTVPSNDQGCVPDHTKASLSQTVPRNPCFGASASLKQGTGNTEKQPAWLQHL